MYQKIAVAVDNSPGSGYAERLALQIACTYGTSITGVHAFTGRFHRSRFQALEGHLPERYQKEDVMEHQRSVHSVLIERGLELISAEYMKRLGDLCRAAEIPFSETITDGKNSDVIIDSSGECDLMVMGAEGLGRTGGITGTGSNTRRMLRLGKSDLLIARREGEIQTVLACIDGSSEAYRMVGKAANLARSLGGSLTIATCFDPHLHKMVFGSLSKVLSKDASQVFKFSEQEKLHNEIIDRSLADLYNGYLDKSLAVAREQGITADSVLLQGKPYQAICSMAGKAKADLIIVGRNGMHRGKYADIGSNAETIAERADTNVLVVTDKNPDISSGSGTKDSAVRAQPLRSGITWSEEAKERLSHVPSFARPMAVMAIERFAQENGYSFITPDIMNRAREKLGI
jgi:nucleotide-binding universal stress UspA family protein